MSRAKRNIVDMLGYRSGRLLVVGPMSHTHTVGGFSRLNWGCRCDCGSVVFIEAHKLRRGRRISCGCARKVERKPRVKGKPRPEYYSWLGARARCLNQKDAFYLKYGGRGIAICERWLKFENFLADMGRRPSPVHSLDRIDNDGPYTPENCRWATRRHHEHLQRAYDKKGNPKVYFPAAINSAS